MDYKGKTAEFYIIRNIIIFPPFHKKYQFKLKKSFFFSLAKVLICMYSASRIYFRSFQTLTVHNMSFGPRDKGWVDSPFQNLCSLIWGHTFTPLLLFLSLLKKYQVESPISYELLGKLDKNSF